VPGDFQTAVHIATTNNLGPAFAYNEAGLLCRLYSAGTNNADFGSPFVIPAGGETWVGFTKFDEFSAGTYARKNINNVEFQFTQANQFSLDNWLLILRQNFTNFYFYERATNNAPWRLTPNKTSFSPSGAGALPDFAGQPMQVGLQLTPYTANNWGVQFEHFMLDAESGTLLSVTLATNGNVVISWPLVSGTLQYTLSLNPTNWQPVGATPVIVNSRYTVTLTPPFPQNIAYYRLAE